MTTRIDYLVSNILKANKAYRDGNPFMSDGEYDKLVDELKEIDPENSLLKKSVIEDVKGKDRVESLPLPMFSLEKVKSWDAIESWLKQFNDDTVIVLTPKYDGISLLTETDLNGKAWTRGDGNEGQESSSRFRLMSFNRSGLEGLRNEGARYCWGEAIMKKSEFEPYLQSGEYKTARNMVAGQFNADEWKPGIVTKIDYVVYGCDLPCNKSRQVKLLSTIGGVRWAVSTVKELLSNKNIFQELYDTWSNRYNIDGIVMDIDNYSLREKLGRLPNGNPRYAIAVKFPEWNDSKLTKVTGITWKVSKDGLSKPVINIEPVELSGATVTNVTGHNAGYIVDNHICENAVIRVRRSGDVIPKHDKTESFAVSDFERTCDDMMVCPSCGKPLVWDRNMIELVCTNDDCEQKVIARNLFFFTTMGIEEVGEPTIKKLYDRGYKSIIDILTIKKDDWCSIDGFGEGSYDKIFSQIEKIRHDEIPVARLLTACNVFHGVFGEKTCQIIFDNITIDEYRSMILFHSFDREAMMRKLSSIKYIGEITAGIFIDSLIGVDRSTIPFDLFVTYFKKETKKSGTKQLSICFSGVRDKELEAELAERCHKVVSGVSKNTDLLIVKDVNGNSSKITKARELGIPVISIDDRDAIWSKINSLE